MKEEIAKILKMLEEGKIDANKASDLISLLKQKEGEQENKSVNNRNYLNKMCKVRVSSNEKDIVNINVPLRLVRGLLKAGHGIATSIPDAEKYVNDIDVDLILEAIENEVEGKIVDIQSEEGEKVAVFIE